MKRLQIWTLVIVVLVIAVAFVSGFMMPDVKANGANLKGLVASLELLPQNVQSITESASYEEDSASLPLIDTYSSVMDKLTSEYYGKPVKERELTYDAIRGMLHALGDPFTRFLDPDEYKKMREENEGNFIGIGAQLDTNKNGEVYVKKPMPDNPAIKAGVKSQDIIMAVDDKPIAHLEIDQVVKLIRGPEDTKVKLTIKRPGRAKLLKIVIVRKWVDYRMVTSKIVDEKNKIGYINMLQFNEKSDEQFDEELGNLEKRHIKGLIFDLRGNPGGLLNVAIDIGSRFLEDGPVVIIQERGGQRNACYVNKAKHNHRRYPLVVLVDKSSASASEIVSGAIKDTKKGLLVGTTTFGKGRVQTIMPLQDGSAVAITTAKYLTPNGTDIHHKGIKPDIYVAAADNFDPNDPATDIQLKKGIDVMKVKLGVLPKGVLENLQKTAQAEE